MNPGDVLRVADSGVYGLLISSRPAAPLVSRRAGLSRLPLLTAVDHHPESSAPRCVFCHNAIPRNVPPEHVIPKWIAREYPGATFSSNRRDGTTIRSKKAIEITTDVVCSDCNKHW